MSRNASSPSMPWLGNVRELRNFVERVLRDRRQGRDASSHASDGAASAARGRRTRRGRVRPAIQGLSRALDSITASASTCSGCWTDTAATSPAASEAAGLDRTYVYRLIRKHGL